MSCFTAGNGVEYCDGLYSALCVREKKVSSFNGIVQLNDANMLTANGSCASCGSPLSAVLYVQ